MAGARGRTRRGAVRATGRRRRGAPTRSACSSSQAADAACPSSSRSATGACSPRRSRSTAARRRSWPPTSPPRRARASTAQLCGDAHLSNFGVFASPDRRLVFDLNDFDETLPGPVGVGRQAARRELRGRRPRPRLRRGERRAAIVLAARARRTARRCASSPGCATSTSGTRGSTRGAIAAALSRPRVGQATAQRRRAQLAKARSEGQPARAREADARGRRRAAHRQRPAAARADRGALPSEAEATIVGTGCGELLRAATADLAPDRRRAARAATGSSTSPARSSASAASARAPGSCCCSGRDDGDPLFLQVKEAQASVLEPYPGASEYAQPRPSAWSRASG